MTGSEPQMAGPSTPGLAVFGAAEGGLGHYVAGAAQDRDLPFRTYGISGHEFVDTETMLSGEIRNDLARHGITDAVITIGVNIPATLREGDYLLAMQESFETNVLEVLRIVDVCIKAGVKGIAVISSNSARIPRSGSIAYCASKAALSMAIQVLAREQAKVGGPIIYGYEPGLLGSTPMTKETEARWDGDLHRIPGLDPRQGLSVTDMSDIIVSNVLNRTRALNGMMLRLDGGDQ